MLNIPDYSKLKISVLGDVMLDRYLFGDTERISPEAPVPVINVKKTDERPGGAANVAINLNKLGIQVSLFGIVGEDNEGALLEGLIENHGIDCNLKKIKDTNTTIKTRIQSRGQQILRFDKDSSFNQRVLSDDQVSQYLSDIDALIISDYAKGATTNIDEIIRICRNKSILTFIDPKGSSFDKYKYADVLTPNESEFLAVVGSCKTDKELIEKAKKLIKRLDLKALLITRSHKGMLLVSNNNESNFLKTKAQDVFDVTGAGDTVISVFAASYAAGESLVDAAKLANSAAGIVVGRIGVDSIGVEELQNKIHKKRSNGICSLDDIVTIVEYYRKSGEKIVMTNGCFDILHAGHIAYLEEAKKLGDRLIIAINNDESVSRLKGKKRPINSLKERMKVLDGLISTDWIVPFEQDTPINIIENIKPDILVKGGDYKLSDVVGAKIVNEYGGEVKILSYIEGFSSSNIIEKLKD